MKTVIVTSLLSCLFLMSVANAQDTLWTRSYGDSAIAEHASSVRQTSDHGFIVAGTRTVFGYPSPTFSVYLVKTDAQGDTLWIRRYSWPGTNDNRGRCVQQTTDGGYIVLGTAKRFRPQFHDLYLLKTDTSGATTWERALGGDGEQFAKFVQQTNDGGYIAVGYIYLDGYTQTDVYLVKTDGSGNTQWTQTYGGSDWDHGSYVEQTGDGGYVVIGYTSSYGAGDSDLLLLKVDSGGNVQWMRTYGGSSDDWANSGQLTADGGYILAGYTESFGPGNGDVYVVKANSSGDTVWTRTYGGTDSADAAYCVQQTAGGGYIVAGQTRSFGGGEEDVYLLRTDANGDTLWTRAYGGFETDIGRSVREVDGGGFVVAGHTKSFSSSISGDVWLLRTAEEQPIVSINIVPDNPPVVVPRGGSFGYTADLTNNTNQAQTVDVWTMADVPGVGLYGPLKQFENVPLAPYQSRGAHFNQNVPSFAPVGSGYLYLAYCGGYPSTVIDSSYFEFEVTSGPLARAANDGWTLTGSFLEGDDYTGLPSEFALLSNYPNPFNISTEISYALPTTSQVKLEVYNLLGQRVATLVDEKQEASYKSVNWDATEVSSGIYFYKLTAGDFTETRRMMLVK